MKQLKRFTFLYDMIYARLAGTAFHLDENEKGLSYKQYRIWGIQNFISTLARFIYMTIQQDLLLDEIDFSSESLIPAILHLNKLFGVNPVLYDNEVKIIKMDPHAWLALDTEQKAIFYLNCFFNAFEATRETLAKEEFKHFPIIPNFKLANFGFLFRAYEYCRVCNQYLFHNGFSCLEKRIKTIYMKEYNETFVHPPKELLSNPNLLPNLENAQDQKFIDELKSQDPVIILAAIDYIEANRITNAIDPLEYLLNHDDLQVAERALEAIILLKDDLK
jgi:hypothetical protein